MIDKDLLAMLYFDKKLSKKQISAELGLSVGKVNWWFEKYEFVTRKRSDAVYLRYNTSAEPFKIKKLITQDDYFLHGLGLGLFWGEGNKVNTYSVRLGNTDVNLIKTFLRFLTEQCGVKQEKIRFGLQVFNDIDPVKALEYWQVQLNYPPNNFMPSVVVSPPQGKGTYRKKSEFGVLTVYVHNKHLREWFIEEIDKLCRHSSAVEHNHGKIGVPSSILGVGSTS